MPPWRPFHLPQWTEQVNGRCGAFQDYWFKDRPKYWQETVRRTLKHRGKGCDYQWSPSIACMPNHSQREDKLYIFGTLYQFFFFLMWTIFQVFIEFITILFLFYILLILASRNVEKIPTKDWTPASCTGRQSLNHRTAREVPVSCISKSPAGKWWSILSINLRCSLDRPGNGVSGKR